MCGIAGMIPRRGKRVEEEVLRGMIDCVAHRGPDGEGVFLDERVGLGHRRLAILDLSSNGAQPMRCPRSGRQIVFNGEVYNFVEIRAELERSGRTFHTGTDTEVILAAYDAWGSECVQRFNGMWAFAIYDPAARTVFCSRDRFGVKPFYYIDTPGLFGFASEIRQLLSLLDSRSANESVLLDSLCFSIAERGTETFFAGVHRLEAGRNLVYDLDSHRYEITRYYAIPRLRDVAPIEAGEAVERFRDLFVDAVRLRLRSDVPVGTCLSGGLDSSSVAAVASDLRREAGGTRFAAITAISEDPSNDESEYARAVVERSDLEWHPIRPDYDTFRATLAEVVRAQEEPFNTPSICMQFLVMREARRQGLPVLLDGQGGDETLVGYERYSVPFVKETLRRDGIGAAVRAIGAFASNNGKLEVRQQAQLIGYFSSPTLRWLNGRKRMAGLVQVPSLAHYRGTQGRGGGDLFEVQKREIESEVIPRLLRYEDKNAMWNSIETRLPFMDYRLVEFALNLPGTTKIRGGWTKYLLRKGIGDRLPESVAWRKRKLGFEAPDRLWLSRLRSEMIGEIRASPLLGGILDRDRSASSLERASLAILWRLYVIALWEREHRVTGLRPHPVAAA